MEDTSIMVDRLVRVVPGRMDEIAAVYDACHADLFGYATSLTRDISSAEDVVHEAFARLVHESRSGRWPDIPRAWLYTVCTNLVFSRGRRRAVVERWQQLVGRLDRSQTDEAAETTYLRLERHSELAQALQTLPADHRAALLLAADGFTGREIAEILGKTEGGARNVLWRARLALKERLEIGGAG